MMSKVIVLKESKKPEKGMNKKGGKKKLGIANAGGWGRETVTLNRPIVADRQIVTLTYADTGTLNGGAAIAANYQYNLNSLFDPDRSGTGHQPGGFDQWANFYNRYRVFRVRYTVDFVSASTFGQRVLCAGINGVNTYSDINMPIENRRFVKWGYLGFSTGASKMRLTGVIDLPSLNGRSRSEYIGSDSTESLFSTSPSEILVLSVIAGSMNKSGVPIVDYGVVLEFETEMFDRLQLPSS